mmetsp:Transcript_4606/g.14603  ORF Transcript_4606/g.14603 Transcript_4606/m.14603 type:complete len:221 (-) Transcript_4606:685-1347(-)
MAAARALFRAPRVVCIPGSVRPGSVNQRLLDIAGRRLADRGCEVRRMDLDKFDLPLFSEEREKKGVSFLPELKDMMDQADGIVVASPEYNGSMTPLLVNAISWLSRPLPGSDEPMYASFRGKVGLVISASPGGLGGLRGVSHTRDLLVNLGTKVIPESVSIGGAFKAFDGDRLVIPAQEQLLEDSVQRFFEEARNTANQEAVCHLRHKLAAEYGEIEFAR